MKWQVTAVSKWVIGKYIRLSQADRDLMKKENKSESESVSHQKALIQNYISCDAELCGCAQYEFYDDGYSGTNFERPSFERLLEKIKKGEINCVIVKDFSRFGRDYIELGDYLERIFPFLGVRFISINDHYDSQDYKGTTGGLDVVMKNIVYDYYSKDLSVKVKTAKYQKMKQGKYLGGHVPYGLMKDPDDKHKLIIDPEAAAVVREIFDMAIAKMRLIDMARILNERGVESPGQYYRRKEV
jgi:DNA invertase Pin-like site-specific DNA recombinase